MKNNLLQGILALFLPLCFAIIFPSLLCAQVDHYRRMPTVLTKTILSASEVIFTVNIAQNVLFPAEERFNIRFLYEVATDTNFLQVVQRDTFDITTTCTVSSLNLALSKDFIVHGLQPRTPYFLRGQARILYTDIIFPSNVSNTTSATTLAPSLPFVPVMNPPMFISSSSITFSWAKAFGNPTLYLFDLATDKNFTSLLANYTALRLTDTLVRVENLIPTTTYFARVRASNQFGNSQYSQYVEEKTLAHQSFSLTKHLSANSFPQSRTPQISALSTEYYVYTQNKNISLTQVDSILLSLAQQLRVSNAWFQNNGLCTGIAGRSEFLVKLFQQNAKIERWGFQQTRIGANFISPLWIDTCECQQSYSYNLFLLPTSVKGSSNISFRYTLSPNPSSDNVKIYFTTPTIARVRIEVFDILGRSVLPPIQQEQSAGDHETTLSVASLASGVYTARLTLYTAAGVQTESLRLLVAR